MTIVKNAQTLIAARRRWNEGRWFLAALLMALASALVPAVCSSGLPATRTLGSAFDPTTSAVALRGRTQEALRAHIVAQDRDDERAGPTDALIPMPPRVQPSAAQTYPLSFSMPAPAPHPDMRRVTSARPRAPPATFG